MPEAVRIPEAASLGLHAMAYLTSAQGRRLAAAEIAGMLHVSEAHLAKVLQRLAKVGLVASLRGPHGGFALGRPPEQIALLEVYEAIEGPLGDVCCLLGDRPCGARRCILGGVVGEANRLVRDYLARTRLSELRDAFAPPENEAAAPAARPRSEHDAGTPEDRAH